MTNNLAMSHELPLSDEAEAEAQGKTTYRFYRLALRLADGDEDAAGAMLRGPLEAIGAIPYKPGHGKWHYGELPAGARQAEGGAPAG